MFWQHITSLVDIKSLASILHYAWDFYGFTGDEHDRWLNYFHTWSRKQHTLQNKIHNRAEL